MEQVGRTGLYDELQDNRILVFNPNRFDLVLDQIYRATTGEVDWNDALRRVASAFEASCVALAVERCGIAQVRSDPLTIAPKAETLYTTLPSREIERLYYTHYYRLDPFRKQIGVVLSPSVLRIQDVSDMADFARSEYYQDLCRKVDCFNLARFSVRLDAELQLRMVINRSEKIEPFNAQELVYFQALGGHIVRALRIQRQVTQMGATLDGALEALERLGRAAFLVDRSARVTRMNALAEEIGRLGDGLTIRDGRLAPQMLEAQRQLRVALSLQLGEGSKTAPSLPTSVVIHRPSGAMPYIAEVTPFACEAYWASPIVATALVTMGNLEGGPSEVSGRVASALGLTQSETRVATLMTAKFTESEIAESLSVSVNTIKTHRKRIYAKLGVTSRLELVSIIGASR